MPYQGVIFDCDGVLVDSVSLSNKVLLSMLQKYGQPNQFLEALENFQTGSLKDCFKEIERVINQKLPTNFETNFRKETFDIFKTDLKPVPGIQELLCKISIPHCVASSGPIEKIRLNLKLTNLLHHFEGKIFSSYEINSWKPEPGIFIHAAKVMGFNPKNCVVIEDSPGGIEAALKGGFQAIALVREQENKIFKDKNVLTVHSLQQLIPMLT